MEQVKYESSRVTGVYIYPKGPVRKISNNTFDSTATEQSLSPGFALVKWQMTYSHSHNALMIPILFDTHCLDRIT